MLRPTCLFLCTILALAFDRPAARADGSASPQAAPDTLPHHLVRTLVGRVGEDQVELCDLGEHVESDWIEEGAAAEAGNCARWTLTSGGLRFVFDPYQVAPYAAGPQEIVVPWSTLEPLLGPAGPVARIERA